MDEGIETTQGDAHSRIMEDFIHQLNQESEADKGLLEPVPIENLDWMRFGLCSSLPARAVTHTRRLVAQLQPKSLRQQVYMICEIIAEDDFITLKARWAVVGVLFGTTGDCIRSMYRNYKQRADVARPGRPRLLNEEQIGLLIQQIGEKAREKKPMTRRDIIRYVYKTWGIEISKKSVNRLVKERQELISSVAYPMERARAEVTRDELTRFYEQLKQNLDGVLPESVVNLDEIGFSRRCRGSPLPCIIPATLDGNKIEYVPQDDLDSTFTLLSAVTLAGESLMPYIVAPVKSLPNEFLTNSLWAEKDCVLDFNASGFANARIVTQWYLKVFSVWLRNHRYQMNKENAPVVLICDGFAGHTSQELMEMMARDNVRLVFLPPHSSHITQALDKFVFAVMKRTYNATVTDEEIADRNGRKINRLLKAFYGSCISPMTIRASWREVGITGLHDETGRSLGIEINGEKIITQHVDMRDPAGYQRKRTNIQQDYLGNRQALAFVQDGRCPHCGQHQQQQVLGQALPPQQPFLQMPYMGPQH